MKAAVLREVGKPLQIEDVRIDKPGPREVLIRNVAAGVCHSDLHFIEGSWPMTLPCILGHESAGVIEAIGEDVRTVKVGDHVITCVNAYCGHCNFCLSGRLSLCASTETKRGPEEPPRISEGAQALAQFANLSSFAEQILTHEHAVVSIRKDMPLDRAALIGCAVITGVGAVTNTAQVRSGESVAVIGCGGVGLAAINGAYIAGAGRIIAIDMTPAKESLARHFGATDFICAADTDPVLAVRELTGGGVDHALECIGLTKTAEQAFEMIGRGGVATVVGMVAMGEKIQIPGASLMWEKRIQGCNMGSNRFPIDMPRLVEFYLQGRLKLDELISRRIKLEDINAAFVEMKTGQIARSVIMFDA